MIFLLIHRIEFTGLTDDCLNLVLSVHSFKNCCNIINAMRDNEEDLYCVPTCLVD
jgi:hypothetical protein